jgi:hypothetical protein
MINTGKFVISLDFELMWGVRDKRSVKNYGDAIIGARTAIKNMLHCFDKQKVKVTFATVGFLFHKTKKDLLENLPIIKPTYSNENLSPYPNIETYLGKNEDEDPYHFGYALTQQIKNSPLHELATHTYCHYYCLEPGQTVIQFEKDVKVAIEVAKKNDITINSIVFPRNQYNKDYLEICRNCGITSYRGTENSWIYKSNNEKGHTPIKRILRLIDSYINITGHHCYRIDEIKKTTPHNIPSSRFLRPYSKKKFFLERFKFLRIKNAMTHAAKNNLVYHLWWHPHNFGRNSKENILILEKILKHYDFLNKKYSFQSITMGELSNDLKKTK